MIIGTAGHIDHGKTSLVHALTKIDTDRLKEEKERGISIDLGFAYMPLPDDKSRIIGFVDVPGHEKFVHTMLAGAASIDFVMLVVAADDGIMPQTREHMAIIDLLGINKGVAVITKCDLVDADRVAEVEASVRNLLLNSNLADIPVLAVSSQTGQGLDELQKLIADSSQLLSHRRSDGRFRLAVDRSFTIQGAGTVVTGTVLSGRVGVGDVLTVSPQGRQVRVRSIRAQNQVSQFAQAGDRCALNLTGDGLTKDDIHRGNMVVAPALHAPTSRIDATLRILPSEHKPLGQWFPVRLHHAATEVGARLVPLSSDEVQPDTDARVQLVLDQPIAAAAGDRFVIRDVSAQRTIGGGTFLDLRAPQRKRRSPERALQLEAYTQENPVDAIKALLSAPPYYLDATSFLRDRAVSENIAAVSEPLNAIKLPDKLSTILMLPEHWQSFSAMLEEKLEHFHAENPDLTGMGVERLRLTLQPRLPAVAFRAALAKLIDDGAIALDGAWVRLSGHEASMDAAAQTLWQRIEPMLGGEARFRPPRTRDIANIFGESEEEIRRVLKLASRMGHVHEVANDHFFLRNTIVEILSVLADMDTSFDGGWFIAARFRDRVDSGRKVAIQILEFFDRNGVTVRRGDLRRLNRRKLELFGELQQSALADGDTDFKIG